MSAFVELDGMNQGVKVQGMFMSVEKARGTRFVVARARNLEFTHEQNVRNPVPQYDTALRCSLGRNLLSCQPPKKQSVFVAPLEGVEGVRVNPRRNFADVDVPTGAHLNSLLAIS
ncbi:hypothetical protein MRX96_057254 [Rhipicephalus microplus]